MFNLTSILEKTSTIKNICKTFVASHLVLLTMLLYTFPIINSRIGTKAFDLQPFGYSVSTAKSIIDNLDRQTIDLYIFPQLTFLDLLYPFILALFLSSLLFRLIRISGLGRKGISILLYLPFIAMLFDYLENVCIILFISKTIQVSEMAVLLSSGFTILKGALTSMVWVTILVYSIIWLRIKYLGKKN